MLPFPQPEFSTLVPVQEAASDASAYYLYDPDNNCCFFPDEPFLGEQAISLLSDDTSWYDDHAEQSCASAMPALSRLPTFHMDYPNTAGIFGYSDCVQSAANDYDTSQYYYPNSGSHIPAQSIPAVMSVQATEVGVPAGHLAGAEGDLGPFSRDACAVATSIGFPVTPDTAGSALEVSQTHPVPIQLTNTATLGSPQVTSQPDRKPCEWKSNQGGMCGELVGWHCERHLADVHGIADMASNKLVTCGACGKGMKRKSILRHFREKHLGFRRSKRDSS